MKALEKHHTNVVVSNKEPHSTSLAQQISELLIVTDFHVIGKLRNVLQVMKVNSQI
jgi:hypothetical protein